MKAFQVLDFDTQPQIVDITTPAPQQGEVQIKIAACGLNFADTLMQTGKYQETPPPPFTLGLEVSGHITAIGPDTKAPKIGTRVAVFAGQGGLAQYGCFPANRLVEIPDAMPFDAAAGFQVAYGTSHVALDHCAHLKAGETLLVLGAAGGVGLTAVEIGKQMGATVIAAARGAEKLEIAKQAGADHVIDVAKDDLRKMVKDLGGADVVYDPVGGDLFKDAFRACNPQARILVIGFASGDIPQIPANHLMVKNISVIGLYWGGYIGFKPTVITDSLATLMQWYVEGRLKPHISHVLPLESTQEALDLLKTRKSTGKVIVHPNS